MRSHHTHTQNTQRLNEETELSQLVSTVLELLKVSSFFRFASRRVSGECDDNVDSRRLRKSMHNSTSVLFIRILTVHV